MVKGRLEKSEGFCRDFALRKPAELTPGMGKLRERAVRRVSPRVGGEKKCSVALSMATA